MIRTAIVYSDSSGAALWIAGIAGCEAAFHSFSVCAPSWADHAHSVMRGSVSEKRQNARVRNYKSLAVNSSGL